MRALAPFFGPLLAFVIALTGCIGPQDAAIEETAAEDASGESVIHLPAIIPHRFDGVLRAAIGTPVVASNPNADPAEFVYAFHVPSDATAVVVEMEWTPTLPTSSNLRIIVEEEGAGLGDPSFASADGTSVLRLDVPGVDVAGKALQTRTFASRNAGLAKDQPFTVHVSIFLDGAPPEGYTAVGPA